MGEGGEEGMSLFDFEYLYSFASVFLFLLYIVFLLSLASLCESFAQHLKNRDIGLFLIHRGVVYIKEVNLWITLFLIIVTASSCVHHRHFYSLCRNFLFSIGKPFILFSNCFSLRFYISLPRFYPKYYTFMISLYLNI